MFLLTTFPSNNTFDIFAPFVFEAIPPVIFPPYINEFSTYKSFNVPFKSVNNPNLSKELSFIYAPYIVCESPSNTPSKFSIESIDLTEPILEPSRVLLE